MPGGPRIRPGTAVAVLGDSPRMENTGISPARKLYFNSEEICSSSSLLMSPLSAFYWNARAHS